MCKNPYDCMYAAYGGSQTRTDMVHGRVGSRFTSGGSLVESPAPIAPEPVDEAPEIVEDAETASVIPITR